MKILILLLLAYFASADEDYNEQFIRHDLCMNGKTQSPIDIEKLASQIVYNKERELYFDYSNWTLEEVDEGAQSQQRYSKPEESRATVTILDPQATRCKRVEYEAIQFHWHTPSEHTFDIRGHQNQKTRNRADLEFHLVHIMKDQYVEECRGQFRDLLVFGVAFEAHQSSSTRYTGDAFFNHMNLGEKELLPKKVALIGNYLPLWFSSQGAYHYKGSLTTPTCSQSVEWYVAKEVQKIEEAPLNRMIQLLKDPSNREVQAMNDRVLYYLPKSQFKKGVPPKKKEATEDL